MGRLEDQLGVIVEDHDREAWRRVPAMVVARFKQAAWAACRLAGWAAPVAGPEDRLWWHPATATAWAEVADLTKRAAWEGLPEVPGLPDVALFVEPIPPPPLDGWVLVKAADGYLEPLARPHRALQTAIGGPNGLTSAIVNGLIGGGLGYGAGWVADRFLPEEHFQKGRLRLTLGLAGLGVGAAPGIWRYTAERRARGMPPPPPGFREPVGYQDLPARLTGMPAYPGYRLPPHPAAPPPPPQKPWISGSPQVPPAADLPGLTDLDGPKLASVHPRLRKAAQDYGNTGALFARSIPVDAFNRVIWNDVRYPPNAFGTKSPWGDNEQPPGTPPAAAAAASGLLAGTAAATGSGVVSPFQVATAAVVGAGQGWATGLAAGKVLGALAGLRPAAQAKLQDVGLWGGLISGVANSLFGGR
jgi:hypothetical protein